MYDQYVHFFSFRLIKRYGKTIGKRAKDVAKSIGNNTKKVVSDMNNNSKK